jgi:hypothetical protein
VRYLATLLGAPTATLRWSTRPRAAVAGGDVGEVAVLGIRRVPSTPHGSVLDEIAVPHRNRTDDAPPANQQHRIEQNAGDDEGVYMLDEQSGAY